MRICQRNLREFPETNCPTFIAMNQLAVKITRRSLSFGCICINSSTCVPSGPPYYCDRTGISFRTWIWSQPEYKCHSGIRQQIRHNSPCAHWRRKSACQTPCRSVCVLSNPTSLTNVFWQSEQDWYSFTQRWSLLNVSCVPGSLHVAVTPWTLTQGVVSLTFRELSKIILRKYMLSEIAGENCKLKLRTCAQSHV